MGDPPAEVFLLEREAGFATARVGFPSIFGCLAVAMRTNQGIYGFHNAGGSGDTQFETRAGLFADFVNTHAGARGFEANHLYGVTFVQDQRGYTMGQQRERWMEELTAFATALGHDGPISGVDMSGAFDGSAYVQFNTTGNGCTVKLKRWNDGHKTTGANPRSRHQQSLIGQAPGNIVTDVTTEGLHAVQVESLR
ncbi:MAG: hypothetical protein RJQ04_13095 [Longimicrobiales bacterium]